MLLEVVLWALGYLAVGIAITTGVQKVDPVTKKNSDDDWEPETWLALFVIIWPLSAVYLFWMFLSKAVFFFSGTSKDKDAGT